MNDCVSQSRESNSKSMTSSIRDSDAVTDRDSDFAGIKNFRRLNGKFERRERSCRGSSIVKRRPLSDIPSSIGWT